MFAVGTDSFTSGWCGNRASQQHALIYSHYISNHFRTFENHRINHYWKFRFQSTCCAAPSVFLSHGNEMVLIVMEEVLLIRRPDKPLSQSKLGVNTYRNIGSVLHILCSRALVRAATARVPFCAGIQVPDQRTVVYELAKTLVRIVGRSSINI